MYWRHIASYGLASLITAAGLGLGVVDQAKGAVVALDPVIHPTFTADFNSAADVVDFSTWGAESGDGSVVDASTNSWATPAGGIWEHQFVGAPYGAVKTGMANQGINVTGVAGNSFWQSTDFHVTSATVSTHVWNLGLQACRVAPTPGNSNTESFFAAEVGLTTTDSGTTATLDLKNYYTWGNPSLVSLIGGPQAVTNFDIADTYTLSFDGSYTGGVLTLIATLTDITNSSNTPFQVTVTNSHAPNDGYFGYHDDAYTGWDTAAGGTVDYSNYRLSLAPATVPEPASLALLGLGGLCLMGRRRRGA